MGFTKKPAQEMVEGSAYYNLPQFSPGAQYREESTFCYKVQSDILCYKEPRSGWENRMVGYQEPLRPKTALRPQPPRYAQAGGDTLESLMIAPPSDPSVQTAPIPFGTVESSALPPLPSADIPAAQVVK